MRVHSIFHSIDGEVNHGHQGALSVFIRLSKCNLKCAYCDTKYAQGNDGQDMTVAEIIKAISVYRPQKVTLTGGEPLLQFGEEMEAFLNQCASRGILVTIETNGSIPPTEELYDTLEYTGTSLVMDYKLPSSGEEAKMDEGFGAWVADAFFDKKDFIKFVVKDRVDFDRALEVVAHCTENSCLASFAFSPCFGPDAVTPATLIEWMKEARIKGDLDAPAVFSYQIHKIIYPNSQTEV